MVEYPHSEIATPAKKPKRKPFGRNQLVGVAALAVPFAFITTWVFLDKATVPEWSGFVQLHVPMVLGLLIGSSAVVKLRAGSQAQ